jgi:hypothetical protein
MFKSISWEEFIIAICMVSGCYYAFIVIVFYRKDIMARLRGGAVSTSSPRTVPNQTRPKNLMGAIDASAPLKRKPIVQSSANAEEIEMAETVGAPVGEQAQSAPADELIQELGNLFEIMKEGKPAQDAYLRNIKTLFSQYTHLIGSEEYTRISQLIIEELKTKHNIFLSTELVEELWPKENLKHSNHSK